MLRCEAVYAVLERLNLHFQPQSFVYAAPAKVLMAAFERVTIMVVSDTNKKHMRFAK